MAVQITAIGLVTTLDGIEAGSLEAREQPGEGVSLAPKILVEDATAVSRIRRRSIPCVCLTIRCALSAIACCSTCACCISPGSAGSGGSSAKPRSAAERTGGGGAARAGATGGGETGSGAFDEKLPLHLRHRCELAGVLIDQVGVEAATEQARGLGG